MPKVGLDAAARFRLDIVNPQNVGAKEMARRYVSTYTVQPGARVLWCLRRRASDVRCVIYPGGMPVEVQVIQDRDIVLTELFQEERLALDWSRAYLERLKEQGWQESPSAT